MPSRTYQLFAEAMATKKPVVCMYQGHPRALCPIILGHTDGAEKALTWQFDGSGSLGPVHGQWKCLFLEDVSDAEIVDGPWRSGSRHTRSQSCVKDVDLDINPDSPYDPKRRLKRKQTRTPSHTYRLFAHAAINDKKVVCVYAGSVRKLVPIELRFRQGREIALVRQVAGWSSRHLKSGGEWRVIFLSRVEQAFLSD